MKDYILYTNEDSMYYVVVNKYTNNELKISKKVNSLQKIMSNFGDEIDEVKDRRN